MKDPAQAKTRLSDVLDVDGREKLALTLFENTLAFFAGMHQTELICVVTPSQRIGEISKAYGVESVYDDGSGGINGAAVLAGEQAKAKGVDRLLVVHADIPVLDSGEFQVLQAAANERDVVIVRSADNGTNALLLTPPNAIPFSFGKDSATAHEKAARLYGKSSVTVSFPHLSHDIDRFSDLADYPCLLEMAQTKRTTDGMSLFPIRGLPEVQSGDDVAQFIGDVLIRQGKTTAAGDIVVIAQKIVSKSEGRSMHLSQFKPSQQAIKIAKKTGKDPRKIEAILSESDSVLRLQDAAQGGLIITRHRQGWVCANAGIDESNLGQDSEDKILLLPVDSDASASKIRNGLEKRFGGPLGVIISDTFGRPWRSGLVNIAIGVAGVPALVDCTDKQDAYGRALVATIPAFADEVAAAAGLLMSKNSGIPAVVVRGLDWAVEESAKATDILRPISKELFI